MDIRAGINDVEFLVEQLKIAGCSTQAAWWLLTILLSQSQASLIGKKTITLTENQVAALHDTRQKLAAGMPLQYILGVVPFLDLQILVAPPVLIPRPETEEWTLFVRNELLTMQPVAVLAAPKILDLCAGTGCIGLSIAKALPQIMVYGVDISEAACQLMAKNKTLNQVANFTIVQSDLWQNLSDLSFDIIVTNPPYITASEYLNLDPSVKNWEDRQALVAGGDGLKVMRAILTTAAQRKVKTIYLEIGMQQAAAVQTLAYQKGFQQVTIWRDMAGKNRMLKIVS